MLPEKKDFLTEEISPFVTIVSKSLGRENIKLFLGFLASLKSKHTIKAYKRDLIQFFEFILARKGENCILTTERSHIDIYGKYLKQTNAKRKALSDSSIKRKLTAISKFYVYLVRCGVLNQNPAQYIERPVVPLCVKTEPVPKDLLLQIFELTSEENLMEIFHKTIIFLFFTTGMRAEQGGNILIQDFYTVGSARKIKTVGKGNIYSEKTLSTFVANLLDRYLEALREHGYPMDPGMPLLRAPRGKNKHNTPVSRQTITNVIKRFCKLLNFDQSFSSHSARATFITESLEKFDIGVVSTTVGHSSLSMTNEYDKRRKNRSKEIGEFLLGK